MGVSAGAVTPMLIAYTAARGVAPERTRGLPNDLHAPHSGTLMDPSRTANVDSVKTLRSHPLPTRERVTGWRWAMAGVGVTCFGLGVVGVFLPVMPTTVFLLLGSFFLTRSCPWLEERMLRLPVLRPYAEFIRSKEPMSSRMRWTAMAMMLTSIGVATVILVASDRLTPVTGGAMALLAVVAGVAIATFRRGRAGPR